MLPWAKMARDSALVLFSDIRKGNLGEDAVALGCERRDARCRLRGQKEVDAIGPALLGQQAEQLDGPFHPVGLSLEDDAELVNDEQHSGQGLDRTVG